MRKTQQWVMLMLVAVSGFLPSVCQAEAPTYPDALPSPAASPAQPTLQQQLQTLQQQMNQMQQDYNARLQQMQTTINTLTAQISKTSGTPQPAPADKPVNPDDQEIGQELIFGPDDMTTAPPSLSTSPSAIRDQNRSSLGNGLGIRGRTLYNPTTQPLSSGNFANRIGQSMNPDIVVSGDFLGHYANRHDTFNTSDNRNRIALREAEFGFSAAVDPYAKATFIFSKPDNGELEVEEGYATLLDLPYGLQAKIGKMRSPFGKINVIHGHDLPQTDRPDVYVNFFGDDGLIESGVAVSKILPLPWYSTLDTQLADGDTGPLFGHGSLSKPLMVSHWKNFFNLTDTQSIELGASAALGPRGSTDRNRLSSVEGIDFTYHWIPTAQRHALIWQTELLTAQREHPFEGASNGLWGGYSYFEYKLNQRWNIGARVDYSQVPQIADASEWAIAPYVDFWESEFGRWRLEYKHTFGDSHIKSSDQIWAQYSVILGLHPPHTF